MGSIKPIPFLGSSYESISKPISSQQAINFYPERAQEAARSQVAYIGTPGLKEFVDVGGGPIRGLHAFNNELFAVSNDRAYRILPSGSFNQIGVIPDITRVSIANNITQVIFVNGTKGFIYTPATATFAEITDPDFTARGSDQVQFLDQYFVHHETGTSRFFISSLNDGFTYDGLDFGDAETVPDTIVSILSSHRDLILFGASSTEMWDNTGAVDFPFEIQNGVAIERGCAAAFSSIKMDNQIYWLGEDRNVYRLDGYKPVVISTHAIATQIRKYTRVDDAFAMTYTEDGHFFYILTFPTEGVTWCYDAASQKWHQRSSGTLGARWRANNIVRFNNKTYVGDSQSGKIFEMSLDIFGEDGDEILRTVTTMPIHQAELPVFMSKIQVYLESGVGLVSGQGSDPVVWLQWSDDGGRTYTQPKFKDIGKLGEYPTRVVWRRLGRFRNRTFRLQISDPVAARIIDASAEVDPGL